ncbi:putative effector [Golovinomyces cichoracearum]|uniref:Putative effector n=1 Tax=Golovinomyces cichoracearum TaxID=62708 RepID=A0A420HBN4_9PEZI|nr:putative effector [Golovinomyces cichoracearum]
MTKLSRESFGWYLVRQDLSLLFSKQTQITPTDKAGRIIISGSVGLLDGTAIFWLSRKKKSVSSSTTVAEYVAVSVTAKQSQ